MSIVEQGQRILRVGFSLIGQHGFEPGESTGLGARALFLWREAIIRVLEELKLEGIAIQAVVANIDLAQILLGSGFRLASAGLERGKPLFAVEGTFSTEDFKAVKKGKLSDVQMREILAGLKPL